MEAVFFKIKTVRRRHMMHLVAQGFGFNVHLIFNTRHLIDHKRMWPSDIDDNRRINLLSSFQDYATYFSGFLADFDDFAIEQKLSAVCFCGDL